MKKYSPIRRARPDEDRPRRPMVDRARRRADLQRIVPAAPALPAAPDPGRERPKIELPSAQYDLLRQLMSTDNEKRPGQVAWKDMISLFEAIGFRLDKGGRKSRGALEVFVPTQDLAQSQVSGICWGLLTCCQVLQCWIRPRCSGITMMPPLRSAPSNAARNT